MVNKYRALVDDAIAARKFPESRRAHYERLMARNPQATTQLIDSLEGAVFVLSSDDSEQARAPLTSDAGREIAASSLGGYVVAKEAEPASARAVPSPALSNQSHAICPDASVAPRGSKSGVIRHRSALAIPLSESDEPVSHFDYLKGNGAGPQAVPPPAAIDPGDGLQPEWFLQRPMRQVEHD
jgi:hypothetical protein